MSGLTTHEGDLDDLPELTRLQSASRLIHDISSSTRPIDAVRVTLQALCAFQVGEVATLEFSTSDDAQPIRVATEYVSSFSEEDDNNLVSVSYPLDVRHQAWRSTCIVIRKRSDRMSERLPTLSALLTILGSTLDNLFTVAISPDPSSGRIEEAFGQELWQAATVDEMNGSAVTWFGHTFGGDFVIVRTVTPSPDLARATHTCTSFWPEREPADHSLASAGPTVCLTQPSNPRALLIADRVVDKGPAIQIVVARQDIEAVWTDAEHAAFEHSVAILGKHINRITNQRHVAMQANYLSQMQALTTAASAAVDLQDLCKIVHEATARFLPLDRFVVRLNGPGADTETMYDVVVPNANDATETGDDDNVMLSSLSESLHTDGTAFGTLLVEGREPTMYQPEHAAILQTIAQSAAGAFERQVLLNRIAWQSRYESGLRLVAERINGTLDATELLQIASDVIHDTVPSKLVVVSVIDRHTMRVVQRSYHASEAGYSPPPPGFQVREGSLTFDAVAHMQQKVASDTLTPRYETFSFPPWREFGTAVATPFPVNQDLLGVIVLGTADEARFTADELSLQRQIAAMLSTAIGNAFAYDSQLRHSRDLGELQHLASRIASQLDLQRSMDEIVQSALKLVDADGSAIAMIDEDELVVVGSVGSVAGKLPQQFPLDREFVAEMLENTEHLAIHDFAAEQPLVGLALKQIEYARALLAVRLIDPEGKPAGIIGVFSTEPRVWTEREISLLTTLSSSSAIAIQNARHFEGTRDLLRATVESLATAVEAKDPGSQSHARQVARYARMISEELDLSPDITGEIELAALLHDIGKIGIPDSVLEKPGALDSAEWAAVQLHPAIGEQILSGNPTLEPLLPMIRHHHERWDGNGYPERLKANQIPTGAAIIAVAEALDTMTAHHPYQPAKSWSAATAEIEAGSGSQFSPAAVQAFSRLNASDAFMDDEARVARNSAGSQAWDRHRSPALDVRALRIMEAVATEIREGADLETFLQNIMRFLRDMLDVPYLAVFSRNVDDGTLEIIASDPVTPISAGLADRVNSGHGIVSWVARHGVIQNIPDVSLDARFIKGILHTNIQSELCVPLVADGQVIGVMNFESDQPHAFSETDQQVLSSTADHIANAIHVVQLHERLKILSSTDSLTGLDNHRAFFDRLVTETTKAIEENSELSVVIMDVNKLKDINDSYGHLAGDAALRAFAGVLATHRRPDDSICRYGGDEFALILPGVSTSEAWSIMEMLTLELMDGEFEVDGMTMPLPTSSWGIASVPNDGRRPIELLAAADERMYIQKTGGRD